jgi:hypothetical protein
VHAKVSTMQAGEASHHALRPWASVDLPDWCPAQLNVKSMEENLAALRTSVV